MQSLGYWYFNKKLFEIENEKHIDCIIKNPETFGLTKEYIQSVYNLHNEKLNMEGKAREQLILEVVRHGWIRVRHYTRPRDYWSIQYSNFRKQEKTLHNLVETLILDIGSMRQDDELVFIGFDDDSYYAYKFMDGGAKKFLTEKILKKEAITKVKLFEDMI